MAIPQQINDYLAAREERPSCDDRLAQELELNARPSVVTLTLGTTGGFTRRMGECAKCGKYKMVIHARRT